MDKAVVLLSGGMDSTVVLAKALSEGKEVHPVVFQYGQRLQLEIDAAMSVAKSYGLRPEILKIDLRHIGGSALTEVDEDVPLDRDVSKEHEEIPVTYVPMRNTIMLSMAASLAEVIGAKEIWYGANFVDSSGYPDTRPEYAQAMQTTIRLGSTMTDLRIVTPLIMMTKAEIVHLGMFLGVPFEKTWSCYREGPKACGRCDSCQLRLKGFKEAGYTDPIVYQEVLE